MSKTPYRIARRAFLRRLGCAAGVAGLGGWLEIMESHAQGMPAPQRFMLMSRPNGTIRREWFPGAGGVLPSASAPFEALRSSMVLFDGLDVPILGAAKTHEAGMVVLLTGNPVGALRTGNGPNDFKNTAPSVEQHLLRNSPGLGGREPLYLIADGRVDNSKPQVANRAAAYTGPDVPIYPELQPRSVYSRLFSNLMPGGGTPSNAAELERARRKGHSVLDFVRADLQNLRTLAPASELDQLDQHAVVIRELEVKLDKDTEPLPPTAQCTAPMEPPSTPTNIDGNVGIIGNQHLALVRAAFVCDLTRLVFFMWTAAASSASWVDLHPGMRRINHHARSHEDLEDAAVIADLSSIDRWYSQQSAAFISSLQQTTEADGSSLLDSTLILYGTECADGSHSNERLPLALFGGARLGLTGGRTLTYSGRTTNDLWLAIAQALGAPLASLGTRDQSVGALTDVFV